MTAPVLRLEENEQAAWEYAGRQHAARSENRIWDIAWWLVEGQGKAFDPSFARSTVILQRARPTLENYYRVGRAYPKGTNHPDLSFDAHRALLREPNEAERAMVLCLALEHGWFANDIERHFELHPPTARHLVGLDSRSRASRNPKRTHLVERKRDGYAGTHVQCPACAFVFPIKRNKAPRPMPVETGGSDAMAPEVAS